MERNVEILEQETQHYSQPKNVDMSFLIAVTWLTDGIHTFICINYFGNILFFSNILLLVVCLYHIKLAFSFYAIGKIGSIAYLVRYFFVVCLSVSVSLRCSCKAEIIFFFFLRTSCF